MSQRNGESWGLVVGLFFGAVALGIVVNMIGGTSLNDITYGVGNLFMGLFWIACVIAVIALGRFVYLKMKGRPDNQ